MLENTNSFTIYQILNFVAKTWWAHHQLRYQGQYTEARRAERHDILSDVDTLRKAQYILVAHGRWIVITGRHANVSDYGGMESPLILAAVLLGVPCVDYSELDRETTIILPVSDCDYPSRTGHIGMLDDVSFDVHATIGKFASARLYNIDATCIEKFAVSRFANG